MIKSNLEKGTCAQHWTAHEAELHIYLHVHLEAKASAQAVQQMLHLIPVGSHLTIQTDASSTAWAWKKGSSKEAMKNIIAPAVRELHRKHIYYEAAHIPGQTNKRADWLSRNTDPKDYALDNNVYLEMCKRYNIHPEVYLFPNRKNKNRPKYCTWRVDSKSLGNAFLNKWQRHICWLNPPWERIPRCL